MSDFASRLITWQKIHGRHDLPWQNTADPYAIWVSEIMLQQTQVASAIGYYSKFMQRFTDIAALAHASQEQVLAYWSGLGYYSRARNLHHAARIIIEQHQGVFPDDFQVMQTLPGIGRSTAAAIASFAFNQVQTILDGNVKRVLARHFLVEGWTSAPKVEKDLWQLAEQLLPQQDMVAYTQGLMDLGATLCSRSKPKCSSCPLIKSCAAYQQHRVADLPTAKPRKVIPEKHITMLILLHDGKVMLEKRPASGIWGGLWSFPETEANLSFDSIVLNQFEITARTSPPLTKLSHTFTHFRLHIQPQPMQVASVPPKISEPKYIWLSIEDALDAAIPTPIRKILYTLLKNSANHAQKKSA